MSEAFFVAVLRCPHCGTIEQREVPTKACWSERDIRLNDRVELSRLDGDYLACSAHDGMEPLRLLENWHAACCPEMKWAVVQIENERLHSVRATVLDAETILVSHWLSLDVDEAFEEATGIALRGDMHDHWREMILPALLRWSRPTAADQPRLDARGRPTVDVEGALTELLQDAVADPAHRRLGLEPVERNGLSALPLELATEKIAELREEHDEEPWVVGRTVRPDHDWPIGRVVESGALQSLVRQALVRREIANSSPPAPFPLGITLGGGWTLVAEIRGQADRGVYLATNRLTQFAIVTVTSAQRDPLDQVSVRMRRTGAALAALLWIGPIASSSGEHVALVEAEPEGKPLAQHWLPFRVDEVAMIGRSLLAALAPAHVEGVGVGGLRPETVYVDNGPALHDWSVSGICPRGEAFMAGQAPRSTGSVTPYTYLYDAPEVLRGGPATPASDVFSVCAVLAHIATAEHPFMGDGAFAQLNAIVGGRRRPFRGPAAIAKIVDLGLVDDPGKRPAAKELADLLAAVSWP